MRTDDNGLPCGTNCTYYGYCLMTNHFHLLIREREEKMGETVKRIASSYVYYRNLSTEHTEDTDFFFSSYARNLMWKSFLRCC